MLGILVGDKVICGPVSVLIVETPHILNGTPTLAGYLGSQGRHRCRVGNFPEARPAFGEVPKTLRPTGVWTSGETEVRGMWVLSPGET